MTQDFSYRLAVLQDIPELIRLGMAAYGQYTPQLGPQHAEVLSKNIGNADSWAHIIERSQGFLCIHNGQIVGMAFLFPNGNPWDIFKTEWSYIRMVGVYPEYAGKGIASTLTCMCIDHAKATGEQTIALHTSEIMPAARRLYEKLGFRILQEIEPRLGKKYWLYTLDLNQ